MTAVVIDGKAIAAELRAGVAVAVRDLAERHERTPGLAVVLVGDDPASQVYVRSKGRATREAGTPPAISKLPQTKSAGPCPSSWTHIAFTGPSVPAPLPAAPAGAR